MRVVTTLILIQFFGISLLAQLGKATDGSLYPVKIDQQWGMINASGKVVISPQYDAIGTFKSFKYAVMQKQGRIGLIDRYGHEIIPAKYDDVKVLDSLLFAVLDASDWVVMNIRGEIILKNNYEQIQIWARKFIGFKKKGKWGIADYQGKIISQAVFDEIELLENNFFQTKIEDKVGLLSLQGDQILPNESETITIYNPNLFFFQKNKKWGAVNQKGNVLIRPSFQSFLTLSDNFIKLLTNNRAYLYSVPKEKIITKGQYETYYSFSQKYVLVKNNRKLGLVDWFGNVLLEVKYDEIQFFAKDQFRVKNDNKWGVVGTGNEEIIPIAFEYITPAKFNICTIKKNGKIGIANIKGIEQTDPKFDNVIIEKNRVEAFQGGSFVVLNFDEMGNLQGEAQYENHVSLKIGGKKKQDISENPTDPGDYLLDQFEWYYDNQQDKWGMRKLVDGSIHIEPVFDWIRMERGLNLTLVGIEKWSKTSFDRTTYRFDMVFGLVDNDNGLLVTPVELLDIRLSDFRNNYPAARVVFENGTHGLINKKGVYQAKDFAFIDEFSNGIARMSMKGRLSGELKNKAKGLGKVKTYLENLLAPSAMTDYTQHDQNFRDEAEMICNNCSWGYIDTFGQVIVQPEYTFAKQMMNGVGFVEKNEKQGAIKFDGSVLLPCQYDQIGFLENTQHQIFKVFKNESKFGLIDTIAKVVVDLKYDEIGEWYEERLAVARNGKWGFANLQGEEVIPCRYRKVGNFQEGYAAVQLGNKWGFIDKSGEIIIEFKYRRVGNFKSGLAWVATGTGVGYINSNDEKVIRSKFNRAYDFEKNVARVVVDGKFGLINLEGDYFLRPKYKYIGQFNEQGIAIVQIGKDRIRYGLITRTGDLIGDKKFKKIQPFKEGLAVVQYKNLHGFINSQGDIVIENKYSNASSFSEGLAAVRKNGMCGYVNKKGEEVVPLKYTKCMDFEDGKAIVFQGMPKAGVIDKAGNEIIEPSIRGLVGFSNRRGLIRNHDYNYYYITEEARFYEGYYDYAKAFQHGMAIVNKNGKWGVINQNGMPIISPKYDKIESFKNGYAKVKIDGFKGLYNLTGEEIVQPEFEFISYAGNGLYRVEQGDKVGYFDQSGDWIWALQN